MQEKQYLIDAIKLEEIWRVFHIMAEFVEGVESLSDIPPAVVVFGSARVGRESPQYSKAENFKNYWQH